MKKVLLIFGILAVVMPMAAKNNNDPILMKVNGKDVPLSEFLYLYGKNTGEQGPKMTVDEYLDLFTIYKLKVADAEAEGMDTTASFLNEYLGYRSELVKPYLNNHEAEDEMVAEAYEHRKREVDVSHIMLAKGSTREENLRQIAILDSLRTEIVNGADFGDIALKYSIDRAAVRNKGHMGWLLADRVPYSFEKAAYDTPVGQISKVVETPMGYHIIRVEGERPACGEVLVQHILKLTQGHSDEDIPAIKAAIDSIYNVLISGEGDVDFSDVARRESEDPGTASKGGLLPWFGRGRMVPEFEEMSFAIDNGEVSKPFKTSYGYHIVKRIDYRGIPDLEEVKPGILAAMAKDGRLNEIARRRRTQLHSDYNVKINESEISSVHSLISEKGGLDSLTISIFQSMPTIIGSVGGKNFTVADVFKSNSVSPTPLPDALSGFDRLIDAYVDDQILELETERVEREVPEFKNLLHEYHDGMLLFDISNKRVWDAALNNLDELELFYQQHRDRYDFESPKYKGHIIYATSDSVFNAIKSIVDEYNLNVDQLALIVAERFGKDAKVEKVLAAKGENRIVDAELFGAAAPEIKGKYKYFMLYSGTIIDHPEEMSDVQGNVVADYQAELEKRWIAELKSKYPVKINKNQLKKLR